MAGDDLLGPLHSLGLDSKREAPVTHPCRDRHRNGRNGYGVFVEFKLGGLETFGLVVTHDDLVGALRVLPVQPVRVSLETALIGES